MAAHNANGGTMDEHPMISRPISELLTMDLPPVCGRLTQAQDICFRPVKVDGDRCWQHRSQ